MLMEVALTGRTSEMVAKMASFRLPYQYQKTPSLILGFAQTGRQSYPALFRAVRCRDAK